MKQKARVSSSSGWIVALASVLGVCAPALALAEQRVAVIVGNNVGHDPARALRYAEQEVGRLADLLGGAGGFTSVEMVRGGSRQEVERALLAARASIDRARKSGTRTLFLFYYSGHGDRDALELGDSRLPLRDLRRYLENSGADVRLAFVDACRSGALTGVKGGHRAPAYEVRLADPGAVKGMAIITSSTASELSQESDDLKGSYFSHAVMTGLRGAADLSGDDQVTLGELYQYAFRRTLANTAASLVGGQHPTFVNQMAGTGEVVLSRSRTHDARLAFPREPGVTYTVLDHRREVVAELTSSSENDLYVALPAGRYQVVRRALAEVAETQLALTAGAQVALSPAGMRPVLADAGTLRKKGGDDLALVSAAPARQRNLLGVFVGAGSSVVPGSAALVPGVGLSYAHLFRRTAVRLRTTLASFEAEEQGYLSKLLRTEVALDGLWQIVGGRFSLMAGPSANVPFMRQRDFHGDVRWSYGFGYGLVATAALRVAPHTALSLSAYGGGELFRLEQARVHQATGHVSLGGLMSF